jgi:hypothetical protein
MYQWIQKVPCVNASTQHINALWSAFSTQGQYGTITWIPLDLRVMKLSFHTCCPNMAKLFIFQISSDPLVLLDDIASGSHTDIILINYLILQFWSFVCKQYLDDIACMPFFHLSVELMSNSVKLIRGFWFNDFRIKQFFLLFISLQKTLFLDIYIQALLLYYWIYSHFTVLLSSAFLCKFLLLYIGHSLNKKDKRRLFLQHASHLLTS